MLAVRRGGDLCTMMGGHCAGRLPWPFKTCYSWAEEWCCWNSRLAQTISIQGAQQLRGPGAQPACGGFTTSELAQIDFSKLDMTQFKNELLASMVKPDAAFNVSTAAVGVQRSTGAVTTTANSSAAAASVDPTMQGYVAGRIDNIMKR